MLVLPISMAVGVVAEGGGDAVSLPGFITNAGKPALQAQGREERGQLIVWIYTQ
jgi:hypothetical protein